MKVPPLIERELRATARRPLFYWLRALIVVAAALKGVQLFDRYSATASAPPRWTRGVMPPGMMILNSGAGGANYTFVLGGAAFPATTGAVSLIGGTNTSNRFLVPSATLGTAPANMMSLVPGGAATNAVLVMTPGGLPMVRAAPTLVGPVLLKDLAGIVFLIALAMGLQTADSISHEKREGTLGLLILSNLSSTQIVVGKLVAHGLSGFTALLAFVPVSMIAVLAGGVTFAQAALTAIGLLNVMFVALSAGLWISAMFRERRHVILISLILICFLAWGLRYLCRDIGGIFNDPSVERFTILLGLTGWEAAGGTLADKLQLFLPWMALVNLAGLSFLFLAAFALRLRWRDAPHRHIRDLERVSASDQAGWVLGEDVRDALVRPSLLTHPRPWDASPIRWRMERLGSAESFIWVPMLVSFLAQFSLLGAMSSHNAGDGEMWGLLASAGLIFTLGAGAFLAFAGGRFFLAARAQQDLEMLLTTEVGGRDILSGQWAVLKKALAVPCAVLSIISLPAAIVVVAGVFKGDTRTIEYLLPLILMALNLIVETLAIFWVAMWFGLSSKNMPVAVCMTIGLVLLAPLVCVFGLVAAWEWLGANLGMGVIATVSNWPVEFPIVGLLMAQNVALILWARRRLRKELRMDSSRRQGSKSAPRLVPQPA